jgi:hypothetical protein
MTHPNQEQSQKMQLQDPGSTLQENIASITIGIADIKYRKTK